MKGRKAGIAIVSARRARTITFLHCSLRFLYVATVVVLLSTSLFLPATVLAENSDGIFVSSTPASWSVSLPARHPRQQPSSNDSGPFLLVDTGRSLVFNNDFRVTDSRRDITSVTVVPVMMSDAGVPSGTEDYWDKAETETAVLSRDSGETHLDLRSSGNVADVSSSRKGEYTGVSLLADDFLGHTREFLQTRK